MKPLSIAVLFVVVLFLYLISCSMMLFNVVLETMRSYCLLHISESEFVCISIILIHAVSTCIVLDSLGQFVTTSVEVTWYSLN